MVALLKERAAGQVSSTKTFNVASPFYRSVIFLSDIDLSQKPLATVGHGWTSCCSTLNSAPNKDATTPPRVPTVMRQSSIINTHDPGSLHPCIDRFDWHRIAVYASPALRCAHRPPAQVKLQKTRALEHRNELIYAVYSTQIRDLFSSPSQLYPAR